MLADQIMLSAVSCIAITGEWHGVHNIPELVVARELSKPVIKLLEVLVRRTG